MLNKICTQISRSLNARCNVSNFTLQSTGYIITSKPTAAEPSANRSQRLLEELAYGHRDTDKLPLLQYGAGVGNEVPKDNADCHSQEDP